MSTRDLGQILARAEDSFARVETSRALTTRSLDRADRVMRKLDEQGGAVRAARQRDLERLNRSAKSALVKILLAVGLISLATIIVGLIVPIGMFGFLAAVGLAVGVAAWLAVGAGRQALAPPSMLASLPNGELVDRFDSYLVRVRPLLPAPAQAQLDGISAGLPPLRQTLERVGTGDNDAQDARRLMQMHLPGLIDRYLAVPKDYRDDLDEDGVSVDARLVEALGASRRALDEMGGRLAKQDMLAFETHGRFIESRYTSPGDI